MSISVSGNSCCPIAAEPVSFFRRQRLAMLSIHHFFGWLVDWQGHVCACRHGFFVWLGGTYAPDIGRAGNPGSPVD